MKSAFKKINFSINNQVATISLNRPDVLNSFNYNMADEVIEAFKICEKDDNIRSIILTGEGRAFCAGQDLAEATGKNAPSIDKIVEHTYNPILSAIRNIPKPVICAVNGVAAGAGANIAIACDITFACESAKFIQSFTNIGSLLLEVFIPILLIYYIFYRNFYSKCYLQFLNKNIIFLLIIFFRPFRFFFCNLSF